MAKVEAVMTMLIEGEEAVAPFDTGTAALEQIGALPEHRIADRRLLALIRKWLRAGVIEDGKGVPATCGTPQGAVVTP
jgi:hypothetical protein